MGAVLQFIGLGKSKFDQSDQLYKQGVRYIGAKNKHLRLYFQSQFSKDMEEDELNYLIHIFEQKTYLLFGSHYSIINLINTDNFLKETFDKIVDTSYKELRDIQISQKYLDDAEMVEDLFNYKIITTLWSETKICRVNYWAKKTREIPLDFNLSPKIIEKLRTTEEVQIYNTFTDNTNIMYFILKKVFDVYTKSVKSLRVYQIGIKTIDETIFTILAAYIKNNPKIEGVSICGVYMRELKHLKAQLEKENKELEYKDEILGTDINNIYHIFNFYQVLAKRTNLTELRVILFIKHYNFAMLALVLKNNTDIRKLEVRNIPDHETETEIDFSYTHLNDYGDNIKDEVFIFMNYLFGLDNLEELQMTHFNFMSEIPFMATQVARQQKNIEKFSLHRDVYLINNDNIVAASYNLSKTKITYLNMGLAYYNHIRRFDLIINSQLVTYVNIGVVDYCSFSALMRHVKESNVETCECILNKPVLRNSLPVFFDVINNYPLRARKLKTLYVFNAFELVKTDNEEEKEKDIKELQNKYLDKLYMAFAYNRTLRKLSFKRPGEVYFYVKTDESLGINSFQYIQPKDYDSCVFLIKVLERKLRACPKDQAKRIIKDVILYRYATFRKLIIG